MLLLNKIPSNLWNPGIVCINPKFCDTTLNFHLEQENIFGIIK